MRQNPPILQLLPIFRYFTRKLCVALMSVEVKKNEKKLSKFPFAQQPIWNNNLFNYVNHTICFTNWVQSGILYVKDLLKDNEQFKTLQEFSDVLSRKSNWLCEYKILKTVTFRNSLSFDMTCCSYLQSILKTWIFFTNGLHCILNKKCNFFPRQSSVNKKIKELVHQSLFNKLFSVGIESCKKQNKKLYIRI